MKRFISSTLVTILVAFGVNAQTLTESGRYESVSKQLVLPVAVVQNDCPLVVEQFFVVRDDKGKYQTEYKVRNNSSKAIRAYRIARLYSDNTGFMGYGAMPHAGRILKPKMSVDTFTSKRILAAPSGEKLDSLQRIVFFMVVDVEFEDGSVFDATPVFESFTKHLERFESTYDLVR
jgi:hypothetical protein